MADTADSDKYDAFNLSDFTEEDFAHIDAILQREGGDNVAPQYGGPAITVELEKPTVDIISKAPPSDLATKFKKDASPFQRYRWKKILWVTDLVSPAWYVSTFVRIIRPEGDSDLPKV
jgi:hypothetical protein